jgi:hypothetical protein
MFMFDGDKLKMEVVAPPRSRLGPPGIPQPELTNLFFTGTAMND